MCCLWLEGTVKKWQEHVPRLRIPGGVCSPYMCAIAVLCACARMWVYRLYIIYIYIHIWRGRERDNDIICVYIHIYIYHYIPRPSKYHTQMVKVRKLWSKTTFLWVLGGSRYTYYHPSSWIVSMLPSEWLRAMVVIQLSPLKPYTDGHSQFLWT